jgi:hypothetical protein
MMWVALRPIFVKWLAKIKRVGALAEDDSVSEWTLVRNWK